jgi:hypothetical protein
MSTSTPSDRTASETASAPASVQMSPTIASARPPRERMSATTCSVGAATKPWTKTIAPSAARTRAVPAPVPLLAPVIKTTRSLRPRSTAPPKNSMIDCVRPYARRIGSSSASLRAFVFAGSS